MSYTTCCNTTYISDTDECVDPSDNNCSSNANCTDTIGSYDCTCVIGYSGNGFTCEGILFIVCTGIFNFVVGEYSVAIAFV